MVIKLTFPPGIEVQEDGYTIACDTDVINFEDGLTVELDDAYCRVNVSSSTSGFIGHIYSLAFSENGNTKNEWLGHYDQANVSNKTPATIPFDSKIVRITLSNLRSEVDCDIEVYRSLYGNGNSNSNVFTWEVRDCRTAVVSTFDPEVSFNIGDKLAVFVSNQGTDPHSPEVVVYLQITSNNSLDDCENWTGNF